MLYEVITKLNANVEKLSDKNLKQLNSLLFADLFCKNQGFFSLLCNSADY